MNERMNETLIRPVKLLRGASRTVRCHSRAYLLSCTHLHHHLYFLFSHIRCRDEEA